MDKEKIGYAGIAVSLLLIILTAYSFSSVPKVVFIGWAAFFSMMLGGFLEARVPKSKRAIIWTYGLSGGAALTSIFFFVVPQAITISKNFGVTGIIAGFLTGLSLHSLLHKFGHSHGDHEHEDDHGHDHGDDTLWAVTLHSASAGLVIGMIYQQMPAVSLLLGMAIISHKLPAGYMITSRLETDRIKMLLLPASMVGTAALIAVDYGIVFSPAIKALFFGFASGIFLHVALDFIPEPEPESHLRKLLTEEEDPLHHELDDVKIDCVLSTIIGAAAVVAAAMLI